VRCGQGGRGKFRGGVPLAGQPGWRLRKLINGGSDFKAGEWVGDLAEESTGFGFVGGGGEKGEGFPSVGGVLAG
jgi:hypothetical protein